MFSVLIFPLFKESFVHLVRSFSFISRLSHFNPFPLFNVLKVYDDKLPLPRSAQAVYEYMAFCYDGRS